jgi:hypothetical protein
MKKNNVLILLAVLALSFSACGNKTNGSTDYTDTMMLDGPGSVYEPLTEEDIKDQVIAYYNELNNVNNGEMNMSALDSIACTRSLLDLMKQAEEKSMQAIAQGSDAYFEDEGYRWYQGLGTPISVQFDDITDPSEKQVEVYLTLTWKGQEAKVRLRMQLEDLMWKINDFADYDTDGVGFRTDLETFLGLNTNNGAAG